MFTFPAITTPYILRRQPQNSNFILRSMCTSSNLTHVDQKGKVTMVDVEDKVPTKRTAVASGCVFVGPQVTSLIKENTIKKGDVLTTAQLAGIIGAKKTSELIPLCHNIFLSHVEVLCHLDVESESVRITCKARCSGKTGVEMEALTGVTIAALTIYDMCKAVTQNMVIKDIKLLKKTGGKKTYINDNCD